MTQRTKKPTETDLLTETPREWRMTIPTDTKEITGNTHTRKMINVTFLVVTVFLLYKLGSLLYNKKVTYDVTKKNTACPSLLSVTRSARDTLIVMKADHLCNDYVLENLK